MLAHSHMQIGDRASGAEAVTQVPLLPLPPCCADRSWHAERQPARADIRSTVMYSQ